jgi:hypothetical protein
MATLDSIAEEIGYSRNELMQSMVKFGLTNRDWRNEGLTAHKRLPRYQENPGMATKPPSAAQLAARARFAEMARSGVLNRKRQIAAKKSGGVKRNPMHRAPRGFVLADEYTVEVFNPRGLKPYDAVFIKTVGGAGEPKYDLTILKSSSGFMAATGSKVYADEFPTAAAAAAWLMDWYKANKRPVARRTNPAKKTVSQKISQLVHEGYPQRQAVAVALNEERAGKVKRNPARKAPARMVHAYALVCMHPEPHTVALVDTLAHAKEIARDYSDRHNVPVAIRSIDVHAAHFIP